MLMVESILPRVNAMREVIRLSEIWMRPSLLREGSSWTWSGVRFGFVYKERLSLAIFPSSEFLPSLP